LKINRETDVASPLPKSRPNQVRNRRHAARDARTKLALSSIVYHELMYGAAASARRRDKEEKIALFISSGQIALIDFNEADASEAADIRADLRRRGMPIGPYDVLIAAQARRVGMALMTANTGEFTRVQGLQVLDWAA
jgi:tRNA(fMet)-specific endonuclease VapC